MCNKVSRLLSPNKVNRGVPSPTSLQRLLIHQSLAFTRQHSLTYLLVFFFGFGVLNDGYMSGLQHFFFFGFAVLNDSYMNLVYSTMVK